MTESQDKIVIAFTLEGSRKDAGLVRFADFVTFVDGALAALRALERKETSSRHARIEYRVTQLEIGSAALTIEAIDVPEFRETEQRVATRLAEGLAALRDGLPIIETFEPAIRDALSRMLAPLRHGVRSVTANIGNATIAIVGQPDSALSLLGAPDEMAAVGSFTGSVDALNVHGDYFFYLYPPIGPTRIKCVFDSTLLDDVRAAVKRYTTVYGLVEYVEPSPFPARIVVDRVVAHPLEAELPLLSQLWGVAPNLTGGLDEVEFIQQLRDAE